MDSLPILFAKVSYTILITDVVAMSIAPGTYSLHQGLEWRRTHVDCEKGCDHFVLSLPRISSHRRLFPAPFQSPSSVGANNIPVGRAETPIPALPIVLGGSNGTTRPVFSLDGSPKAAPGCQPCFMSNIWPMFVEDSGAGGEGAIGGGVPGADREGEDMFE